MPAGLRVQRQAAQFGMDGRAHRRRLGTFDAALGYQRFFAVGGDSGGRVTAAFGSRTDTKPPPMQYSGYADLIGHAELVSNVHEPQSAPTWHQR